MLVVKVLDLPVDCRGCVPWQSGLSCWGSPSWRIPTWRSPWKIWQLCEGWRIQLDDLCPGCLSASPVHKKFLMIKKSHCLNDSCWYRWFLCNLIILLGQTEASVLPLWKSAEETIQSYGCCWWKHKKQIHASPVPSRCKLSQFCWFLLQLFKIVSNIAISTDFCRNCWHLATGAQRWSTFGRKLACTEFFWKDPQIIAIISPSKLTWHGKGCFLHVNFLPPSSGAPLVVREWSKYTEGEYIR